MSNIKRMLKNSKTKFTFVGFENEAENVVLDEKGSVK